MKDVAIFDGGNDLEKIKTPTEEIAERHALLQLSEDEYSNILKRYLGRPPTGYARVNSVPYAYGHMAESRGADRRSGAARYTKDYYGVMLAIMLAHVYPNGADVYAFCSHAPDDLDYADDLLNAALGAYEVEQSGETIHLLVSEVSTFDEPLGGLMNVMLTKDGTNYARGEEGIGRALVIDIGGHTTDFLSVAEGGLVDQVINKSERIGIQQAVSTFEKSLRSKYKDEFKGSNDLVLPDRIRKALRTGTFKGGGKEYDCLPEARAATDGMLRRIADIYQQVAGGPTPWDSIILTGGGSGMLYYRLTEEVLNHSRVLLADDDIDKVHFANVRGGMKLYRFYEAEGAL